MTPLDSEIVFYAFRYCLGRSGTAADTCAGYLIDQWGNLDERIQNLIAGVIREAIAEGDVKNARDVRRWESVLQRAEQGLQTPEGAEREVL